MRGSGSTSFVAWSVLLPLVAAAPSLASGEPVAVARPAGGVIAPAAGAAWAEVPTPEGGPVSAFVAHGGGLLAAGGPVFRSKTGATWTMVPRFAPGPVGVLAASAAGLFALTPSAAFRSADGGTTWVELPFGALANGTQNLLDMSATSGTLLVVGMRIGLVRHDRAAWKRIPLPAGASLPWAVATDGARHFAFMAGKLWSLDDASAELKATEGTDPFYETRRFAVAGKKVYALGDWPAGQPRDPRRGAPFTRVAVSLDEGKTWRYRDSPAGAYELGFRPVVVRGELFLAGKKGVFSTRDDGETWTPVGTGLPESWNPAALAVTAKGVVAGDPQGVQILEGRSGTWRPANAGLGHRDGARKLLPLGKDLLVLLSSEQLLLCSTASCAPLLKGAGNVWGVPDGTILASAAWQEVPLRLSRDAGKTWLQPRGLPAKKKVDEVIGDRRALFARIGNDLFSSSDGGESWRPAAPFPDCGILCGPEKLGAFGAGLHAALSLEGGDFLLRSLDGGRTWTQVPGTTSPEKPLLFRAMAGDGETVFVAALTRSAVRVFRADAEARKRRAGEVLLLPKEDGVEGGLVAVGRQVLASSVQRGLLVSGDEGDTWSSFAPQPPGPLASMLLHDGALYGALPDGRAVYLPLSSDPGAK